MMIELYPSLISSDLLNLERTLATLDPYVAGYHLDIMDFHFVANLTWGPDHINAIAQKTTRPLMIHLMVEKPEDYLSRLQLRKNDAIAVHPESPSCLPFPELLLEISERGYTPSIALNPETDPDILLPLSTKAHHTLLLAVNPGFSGQKLIPTVFEKITKVQGFKITKPYTIALDGGVTLENKNHLMKLGVHQLIAGSAIFRSPDPVKAAQEFLESF